MQSTAPHEIAQLASTGCWAGEKISPCEPSSQSRSVPACAHPLYAAASKRFVLAPATMPEPCFLKEISIPSPQDSPICRQTAPVRPRRVGRLPRAAIDSCSGRRAACILTRIRSPTRLPLPFPLHFPAKQIARIRHRYTNCE